MYMSDFDKITLLGMMDKANARGNYFDVTANTQPAWAMYLFNVLNTNLHNFEARLDEAVILRRWLFKVSQIGLRDCEKKAWPADSIYIY